jgi:hypothetical protein
MNPQVTGLLREFRLGDMRTLATVAARVVAGINQDGTPYDG